LFFVGGFSFFRGGKEFSCVKVLWGVLGGPLKKGGGGGGGEAVKARCWEVDSVCGRGNKFSSVGLNFESASLHYDAVLITLGVAGLLLGGNLEGLY